MDPRNEVTTAFRTLRAFYCDDHYHTMAGNGRHNKKLLMHNRLTITLQLLLEDPAHQLSAHVAEGGGKEGVVLEAMRDVNLKPLLQVL